MEIMLRRKRLPTKVRRRIRFHNLLVVLSEFYFLSVLQENPGDKDAFHYKVVCLLHQSLFREAIDVIASAPKKGLVNFVWI